MAQFDFKLATLYIQDGTTGAAAVNNASGYTAGQSTVLIDGHTGIIPVGSRLTFGSDATLYTVTAHTETTGNTTSITVTPVLVDPLTDNEVIALLPKRLEVLVGNGNLTWSEKKPREYIKNRGRLQSVRNGDEDPMDVKLDAELIFIGSTGSEPPTVEEALKGIGGASGWVSTSTDPCEPYCVDLILEYRPICPGVDGEDIILREFRYEDLAHDAKAGTIAVTGKCNAKEAEHNRVAA